MLGLRRYKNVQIDIWQGEIDSFAVDALVHFVAGEDAPVKCAPAPSGASASLDITAFSRTIGAPDSPKGESPNTVYESIFACAESNSIGHLALGKFPEKANSDGTAQRVLATAMGALKNFINNQPPTNLYRVTFVAKSGVVYDSLQAQLFARFEDELDDEGY